MQYIFPKFYSLKPPLQVNTGQYSLDFGCACNAPVFDLEPCQEISIYGLKNFYWLYEICFKDTFSNSFTQKI